MVITLSESDTLVFIVETKAALSQENMVLLDVDNMTLKKRWFK